MPRLEFPTGRMKWRFDKSSPFYASDRKILQSQATDQFTELFERFNYIIILKIAGVEKNELQEIRRSLSNQDSELYSELYIGKHSLTRVAIDGLIRKLTKNHNDDDNEHQRLATILSQFKELLVGEIGLLFTNCENYFDLKKEIGKHVTIKQAKAGSIVKEDVYFEGSTGLAPHLTYVFLNCNVRTRIRMGRIELLEKQRILKAGDVCSPEVVRMLNLLQLKVIRECVESLYLFSKRDACIVTDEMLGRDWFENCVEAANQMTALSMECSLLNELTVIADIKKGILDLVVLDTETECEMRYRIRKEPLPPSCMDNHDDPIETTDSSDHDTDIDYFDLFS
ncbi:hypothetical protein FDP41_010412 [Naegleria fowleri]|uniref:Large ribosomal subunit protein uL10-like insertion domain-containing protein n=1 Tax=Naegleria fowleri TaxID=5763 RepID=A0A6A5C1P2_NAEFO|nr:uncharacterized protein FDP41_010412 [Naegleria fowleri]KAF0983347.1 hypothetical protein FDP41_010412 [Naegleria fowleri]CAG4713144.1 unnamed protein product [Naegleria fowleri]